MVCVCVRAWKWAAPKERNFTLYDSAFHDKVSLTSTHIASLGCARMECSIWCIGLWTRSQNWYRVVTWRPLLYTPTHSSYAHSGSSFSLSSVSSMFLLWPVPTLLSFVGLAASVCRRGDGCITHSFGFSGWFHFILGLKTPDCEVCVTSFSSSAFVRPCWGVSRSSRPLNSSSFSFSSYRPAILSPSHLTGGGCERLLGERRWRTFCLSK